MGLWDIYGDYTPQQYGQNLQTSLNSSLFGRRNSLLDSTPMINTPQPQNWREMALRNFLPNYQNLNNQFRESFGRLTPEQFPYSPYQQPEAFPGREDLLGYNVFGTPPQQGDYVGNPPFAMHPTLPPPPPVTPPEAPPETPVEPESEAPAAYDPRKMFVFRGNFITPDRAWALTGTHWRTGLPIQMGTELGDQQIQESLDMYEDEPDHSG